jgi:cell wall-associated NlpC family hydrolase
MNPACEAGRIMPCESTMPDFGRYIGIAFKDHGRGFDGCDCWGLVRLVYQNEYGIKLPDMGPIYEKVTDEKGMMKLYVSELPSWEKVEIPQIGDVVLLRACGLPIHVGIVVSENQMLHIEIKIDAVIERFDSALWGRRIEGFYRRNFTDAGQDRI